jgi:hypothetical protein
MGKEYRIHIRGEQREEIDADLVAQLVVLLGRQLAEQAKQAKAEQRGGSDPQPDKERSRTTGDEAAGAAA